ncbi:RIP metalloprotease RseP [Terrimonas alba]|uniref:RIP metalloprotease RseP n=1 Tax=Terrimonas alba TaxID=3349636 RepID=UPI0035F2F8E2
MYLLAINWGAVGVQVGQLLLALSILIVLHEFGHYITARWFGCRVEKFFLFFDPWFSLVKKKVGETVYGIGWLPLGGYVKISGMIDESMDKEAMKQPPKEWEFRSKPAWQRLIIMLGGIIMNVLVAFIIYAFVLMIWGDKKIPSSSLKYGIQVTDSTLQKIGLKSGDKIIAVDGETIDDFERTLKRMIVSDEKITIERDGKVMDIHIPEDLLGQLIENKKKGRISLIEPRIPAIALFVPDTSRLFKAGLRKDDQIVGIDSVKVQFYDELKAQLDKKQNKEVLVTVLRNNQEVQLKTPVDSEGKLGFGLYGYRDYQQMDSLGWLKLNVTKYGFFAAFPAGIKKTGSELSYYIDQFKKILNPRTGGYKGLGGFKAIGSAFAPVWIWESFWTFTAFLSIILAFMNLLPIPALDGGHVMFTLYEMVSGRKPNEKFMEYAQVAGMILLLLLMLYANGNDWFGWGK